MAERPKEKRVAVSETERNRAQHLARFWQDAEVQLVFKDIEADLMTLWAAGPDVFTREGYHAEWRALAKIKQKFTALCAPVDVAES